METDLISFDEPELSFCEQLMKFGTQYYSTHNTKRFIISSLNMFKIIPNVEKYLYGHDTNENRKIDKNRVNEIEEKLICSNFECRSSITFGLIQWENPKLIDGQHRFTAYMRNIEPNIYLDLIIINFQNEKERRYGYIDINSGKKVDPLYLSNDTNKKNVCVYISNHLLNLFLTKIKLSDEKNYIQPYMNADELASALYERVEWDNYIIEEDDLSSNNEQILKKFKEDL